MKHSSDINFIILLVATGAILLNSIGITSLQAQTTQNTTGNKSQLESELLNFYPSVEVEFNGNATLVLKADEDFLLKSQGNLASLWNAIDTSKEYGYELDEVITSGMGSEGNPTRFYVIMSLGLEN